MRPAVLVRGGARLFLVYPDARRPAEGELDADPARAAEIVDQGYPVDLSTRLGDWLERARGEAPVAVDEPRLRQALARSGVGVSAVAPSELKRARQRVPRADPSLDRRFHLTLARLRVDRALSSPVEALVSLAREEERLERALGREAGAGDSWVSGASEPLRAYATESERFRMEFAAHHDKLSRSLDLLSARLVPNLCSIVGPRVAARLVAAAGSVETLARSSASKVQLLGARRRPAHGRGPKFGILYQAVRPEDLPLDRQGAFARSLSALAVIAARADAFTHADLSSALARRKDRRLTQLRGRGSP